MIYELVEVDYDDYDFIFYIKKVCLKDYIEKIWGWDESFQHHLLKQEWEEENMWIITVDEKKIGLLSLSIDKQLIYITNILLLPEYQGYGIGTSILKALIKKANYEAKELKLSAFKDNLGANRLYKKLGFTNIDENETHYIFSL